jgi:hypothetical protein
MLCEEDLPRPFVPGWQMLSAWDWLKLCAQGSPKRASGCAWGWLRASAPDWLSSPMSCLGCDHGLGCGSGGSGVGCGDADCGDGDYESDVQDCENGVRGCDGVDCGSDEGVDCGSGSDGGGVGTSRSGGEAASVGAARDDGGRESVYEEMANEQIVPRFLDSSAMQMS